MKPNYRAIYKRVRDLNPRMPPMFDDNIRLIYTHILRSGDNAIDCGSHTGKHTIPIAECIGPLGKVYAFEPIPEKNKLLRQKITQQGIRNIELRECAVGDSIVESKTFYYIRNDPGKSSFQLRRSQDAHKLDIEYLNTQITTLDSEDIPENVTFIKMDIEGHEYKALQGASQVIERNRPIICMEHASGVYDHQVDSGKYFQFFSDRNYSVFDILGNPLQTEEDFRQSASAPGVYDYWMAPRERHDLHRIVALLQYTYIAETFEPTVAVTVGVACYNVGEYLEDCLNSLLEQTFDDFEIIIVNDGSVDHTASVISRFAAGNRKIRDLHQPNLGLGITKNRIVRAARGQFITFVDADDWLALDCLESTYLRAVRDELDVLAFGWVRVEDVSNQEISRRVDYQHCSFDDPDGLRRDAFSGRLNLMGCASLVRTRLFHDFSLCYPSTEHEDIYVTPFLYLLGSRHGYQCGDFYFWRRRAGSKTETISRSHIDGIVGAFHSWKYRLSVERQFKEFRHSFVSGSFAYISTLLDRIDQAGDDKVELIEYLRGRIQCIPELARYRRILSRREQRMRAGVISFIENRQVVEPVNQMASTSQFPRLLAANRALRRELDVQPPANEKGKCFDFAFGTHKDYHVQTAFPVANLLRQEGFSVCFLDFTKVHRDEGVRTAVEETGEAGCFDISTFLSARHSFSNLVVFNDWDKVTTKPLVLDARAAGLNTIGFVEGINDFFDVDTARNRNAYRSCEWVLGSGRDDSKYFVDFADKFRVVGFPRIAELLQRPHQTPVYSRVVINVNFTYGVLEERRDEWLSSAIEGCRIAGVDWVITQHPADTSCLSEYPVDPRKFHELMEENAILVSRFSSCIIESLAMGRSVVYHNPKVDKVEKFRDSLGAYSISDDSHSLATAIVFELGRQDSVVDRRAKFLEEHCNLSSNFDPYGDAARILKEIATQSKRPPILSQTTTTKHLGKAGVARARIVRHIRTWATSVTSWAIVAGLALSCIGIAGIGPRAWIAGSGLILLGLVVAKEAFLWRWRRERDREQSSARLDKLRIMVREARTHSDRQAKNALMAERDSAQKTLASALASALATERDSAQKALENALAAERRKAQQALSTERRNAQRALSNALAAERRNAQKGLSNALAAERNLTERRLSRALVAERSRGSSVDVHPTGRRSRVTEDSYHTYEHRKITRAAMMVGKSIYRPEDRYGNTGNMVHQAAAQKIIGEFDHYNMDSYLLDEQVEEIEASNSHLVVVLANDIRIGTDATPLARLHDIRYNNISRIDLPVLVLGLGAQAPSDFPSSEEISIPSETRRLLRLLSERSLSVAVRGERTADIMSRIGIDNVTVTGCQSAFSNLSPHFPYNLTDMDRPECGRIALNSTYMDRECYLIRFAIEQGFDLIGQSHFREEDIFLNRPLGDEYTVSERKVFAGGIYSQETYEAYIRSHFRKFYDLDGWCDAIRGYRLMWGSRLHGCMLALQVGTPALWVTHDLRTEEVCQHHSLPYVNLKRAESFRHVDDIRNAMDYSIFVQRYPRNYAIMHDYLEHSGVQHQLPRPQ